MFQWNLVLVHKMPLANYQPLITIPNWELIDQQTEEALKNQKSFPEIEKYLKSL